MSHKARLTFKISREFILGAISSPMVSDSTRYIQAPWGSCPPILHSWLQPPGLRDAWRISFKNMWEAMYNTPAILGNVDAKYLPVEMEIDYVRFYEFKTKRK